VERERLNVEGAGVKVDKVGGEVKGGSCGPCWNELPRQEGYWSEEEAKWLRIGELVDDRGS